MFLFSQTIHPDVDYYPLHIGNYWEYIEQWNGSPDISVFVEKDTLLSNGNLYKKIVTKFLYSGNIRNITYERIDSLTAQVYRYSEYCGHEILIDSLAAMPEDIFQADRYRSDTRCTGTTFAVAYYPDSLIVGNSTQVKGFISFIITDPPYYTMAKGFGIVRITGYIFLSKLEYAEINGVSYGTPASVIYENDLPLGFNLYQNYPNPFNPSTIINYSLPVSRHVTLKVFDILGREVAEIVNEQKETGTHAVVFDASNLMSGIYFYQIRAGKYTETRKLILQK